MVALQDNMFFDVVPKQSEPEKLDVDSLLKAQQTLPSEGASAGFRRGTVITWRSDVWHGGSAYPCKNLRLFFYVLTPRRLGDRSETPNTVRVAATNHRAHAFLAKMHDAADKATTAEEGLLPAVQRMLTNNPKKDKKSEAARGGASAGGGGES